MEFILKVCTIFVQFFKRLIFLYSFTQEQTVSVIISAAGDMLPQVLLTPYIPCQFWFCGFPLSCMTYALL
jgi:hypothetical protein